MQKLKIYCIKLFFNLKIKLFCKLAKFVFNFVLS